MAKTIVLIDDDQDDLDVLKEAIAAVEPSSHCISFIYPTEAIRVVSEDLVVVPDFFFIDINMPGMTGDKCVSALRQQKQFTNSIITVLSTSIPTEVSEALKSLGADYTFRKPSDISSYNTILEAVFKKQNDSVDERFSVL
jgi:CheY-like chemotaxis protein